jgi:hypothetical protein
MSEQDTAKENAVRAFVGAVDPKNEDAHTDYVTMLRRAQAAIDKELFVWTSGVEQPPGPSGAAQVAPAPPAPKE